LRNAPDLRLPADVIQEDLAIHVPHEPTQDLFNAIVTWGRYGELIGYDPDTEEVYLDQESTAAPAAAAQ